MKRILLYEAKWLLRLVYAAWEEPLILEFIRISYIIRHAYIFLDSLTFG